MTVSTKSPAAQQVELLSQMHDLLREHPAGEGIALTVVPEGLDLAQDELLVQRVNAESGVLELFPKKISELTPGDVVRSTQVIDPQDAELSAVLMSHRGQTCLEGPRRPDGSASHLYGS